MNVYTSNTVFMNRHNNTHPQPTPGNEMCQLENEACTCRPKKPTWRTIFNTRFFYYNLNMWNSSKATHVIWRTEDWNIILMSWQTTKRNKSLNLKLSILSTQMNFPVSILSILYYKLNLTVFVLLLIIFIDFCNRESHLNILLIVKVVWGLIYIHGPTLWLFSNKK